MTTGPIRTTDPRVAGEVLAEGGLVGLPTETVYGLAADAADPVAVRRVFAVKGRPTDHPLIVHLASIEDVDLWAVDIRPDARALAEEHWPGPLTLVLQRRPDVPDAITGGQDTVAVRVPGAPLARAAIAALGEITGTRAAVVAPSANAFGGVSPTTADHVLRGLAGLLTASDAVLDGGPCPVGLESTIVDATGDGLRVLRPGAVAVADTVPVTSDIPRVPGVLASHYAPTAQVLLAGDPAQVHPTGSVGLIALAGVPTPTGWLRLAAPDDDRGYARMLYAALRSADEDGLDVVVAVPPDDGPLAPAVLDRLRRASAQRS